LPAGRPGKAELIDGAVQQAAHPGRQSMAGLSWPRQTIEHQKLIDQMHGDTGTPASTEAGRNAAPLRREAS
jgi:hypothetical protein